MDREGPISSSDRHTLEEAFSRPSWTSSVEALNRTLGLSVSVLDPAAAETITCGATSKLCEALLGGPGIPSASCLSEPDRATLRGGESVETECSFGLRCFVVPVRVAGAVRAQVMLSGYLRSRNSRSALRTKLRDRGVSPEEARALAASAPVLDRARLESVTSMLEELARSSLSASSTGGRVVSPMESMEIVALVEREFAVAEDVEATCHAIARSALLLVEADAAALVGPSGKEDNLEVLATAGDSVALLAQFPATVLREETREVLGSGRAVLATGLRADGRKRSPRTAMKIPLHGPKGPIAVLIVAEFGGSGRRLDWDDLRTMETYGERAAAALARALDERARSLRALELEALLETSKYLGSERDPSALIGKAGRLLDKWVDFELGGAVLDSGPEPEATLILHTDISRGELEDVCTEVLGRASGDRRHCLDVVPVGGTITDTGGRRDLTVLSVPLSGSSQELGALFAASASEAAFTEQDERTMRALADVIGGALEAAMGHAALTKRQERTLQALVAVADAAESYTDSHSGRVMELAMALGDELGLGFRELEALRFAGLLHDVGMVGVSREILLKPSQLTDDEMAQVRRHTELGASIVEQMDFLASVTPIVLHHHERWDGAGYPKGLSGEQIPLMARILAVADAFAAMTSGRNFRPAMSPLDALDEVKAVAGKQFDPQVVDALVALLDRRASAARTGLLADHFRDPGRHMPA